MMMRNPDVCTVKAGINDAGRPRLPIDVAVCSRDIPKSTIRPLMTVECEVT